MTIDDATKQRLNRIEERISRIQDELSQYPLREIETTLTEIDRAFTGGKYNTAPTIPQQLITMVSKMNRLTWVVVADIVVTAAVLIYLIATGV